MEKVSEILGRFKNALNSRKATQDLLSETVKEELNIVIPPENFSIKNDTIFINCNSVIKNEILIRKENILKIFKEKGGSADIVNIL
ncbi:MAG: hypothetical protein ACLFNN_00140 [Candidatus Paceibacterota bacterium]